MIEDKRRLILSNKFTRDQSDEISKRRTLQATDQMTRHIRQHEKVELAKMNVAMRRDFLANEKFNDGQKLLSEIKGKHSEANEQRNKSLEKVKR